MDKIGIKKYIRTITDFPHEGIMLEMLPLYSLILMGLTLQLKAFCPQLKIQI